MKPSLETLEVCEKCNGPLKKRALAPQPFLLTLIFGVSFGAMLIITHFKKLPQPVMWGWSGVQLIIGLFLMQARIRAKKMVFHCTRCDSPLR